MRNLLLLALAFAATTTLNAQQIAKLAKSVPSEIKNIPWKDMKTIRWGYDEPLATDPKAFNVEVKKVKRKSFYSYINFDLDTVTFVRVNGQAPGLGKVEIVLWYNHKSGKTDMRVWADFHSTSTSHHVAAITKNLILGHYVSGANFGGSGGGTDPLFEDLKRVDLVFVVKRK